MGYVLLGHGGLDVDPAVTSPDMGVVAIPQGTSVQFYCDPHQKLGVSSEKLEAWENLHAPWPPLDNTRVTYNLSLTSMSDFHLSPRARFGGHTLILPGRDVPTHIQLCNGNMDTCPTDPRQVAAGMDHGCGGILGTLRGELYWIACLALLSLSPAEEEAADASLAGRSRSVSLGSDPDWIFGEADREAIAHTNSINLMSSRHGIPTLTLLGGHAFLLGNDHQPLYRNYARHGCGEAYDCWVTKYTDSSGRCTKLEIEGVPYHKQQIVRDAVTLFADTEPIFL